MIMKLLAQIQVAVAAIASSCLLLPLSAAAQIVPDQSQNSAVSASADNSRLTIQGGTASGANLFHSFDQFSVGAGQSAVFTSNPAVQNIITRVTGIHPSTIDGRLAVEGSANLFLLNPNGISFGANASLAINGSFLASTAPILRFADGARFSANLAEPAVLTVSTPTGIQWGDRPAAPLSNAAQLFTGNGLSLSGGNLSIAGHLNAGGDISVEATDTLRLRGRVTTKASPTQSAGDIHLQAPIIHALNADVSSQSQLVDQGDTGSISITASRFSLIDSSVGISNKGSGRSGDIRVQVRGSTQILGTQIGTGGGGNLSVFTDSLTLGEGSRGSVYMSATASDDKRGGALDIRVRGALRLSGRSVIISDVNPGESEDGGDITVRTDTLLLRDAARILSGTSGTGDAGNVTVTSRVMRLLPGGQIVSNSQAEGNVGAIWLQAREAIWLQGDGQISSAEDQILEALRNNLELSFQTSPQGDQGGSLVIESAQGSEIIPALFLVGSLNNAAGFFVISYGQGGGGQLTVDTPNLYMTGQARVLLSAFNQAEIGDLIIRAGRLQLEDSWIAALTTRSLGGNVSINAEHIDLNRSQITALTVQGTSGNLNMASSRSLLLQNGSQIAARAFSTGNGGNISINSGFVIANPFTNDDITASASQGQGGSVQINADAILGLTNRPDYSPFSDITATSDFGTSGIVQINTSDVGLSRSLVELPSTLVDASTQISQACSPRQAGSLMVTGRGGLPADPTELLNQSLVWQDERGSGVATAEAPAEAPVEAPVEATGWVKNASGTISLVTDVEPALVATSASCQASHAQ